MEERWMDLGWTLNDGGLQVSEKHRDDISKKWSEQRYRRKYKGIPRAF